MKAILDAVQSYSQKTVRHMEENRQGAGYGTSCCGPVLVYWWRGELNGVEGTQIIGRLWQQGCPEENGSLVLEKGLKENTGKVRGG